MTQRIAVTPRSLSANGHPELDRLRAAGFEVVFPAPGKQPSESDLLSVLPHCVGYLAGVEPIPNAVLSAAPRLRVISRNGVGVDNIDLDFTSKRGIEVCKALGANSRGVAELAIAFMLSGLRHIAWSDRTLRSGQWERQTGREVEGRTLGILGCGAIGRTVAVLATGLGMTVKAYDPLADKSFMLGPNFSFADLPDVLASSDVITLHCPPATQPLINAASLQIVRKGVVVINTARAELIDSDAMHAALEAGQVSCYATDVYPSEPPELTPLLAHKNTILMPHAGGLTVESVERATRIAVDNLLQVLC